jgi:hypothetical protein
MVGLLFVLCIFEFISDPITPEHEFLLNIGYDPETQHLLLLLIACKNEIFNKNIC